MREFTAPWSRRSEDMLGAASRGSAAIGKYGWAMLVLLAGTAVLALACRSSYWLTCLADGLSCALWAVAVGAMLRAAILNSGRVRVFWFAFAAGAVLAGINLGAWAYFDIVLRSTVPDPFWADIPLFPQPVPMMAALALQPHRRRETPKLYLGTLNFLILLLWWVYLYSFRIFPHEYIVFNAGEFNRYYNTLYILEFLILLSGLGWFWMTTSGSWRRLYGWLLIATAGYTLAFQALNSALLRGGYYPGSLYDVFDNAATCAFIWVALSFTRMKDVEQPDAPVSLRWSVLWSIVAALAVLSVPVLGVWTLFQTSEPPALQNFRIAVTLVASGALACCVFLRQRVMDRRLTKLLASSQETLDNMQRVQAELVHKERTGSVGQLVAGAAHEINNPLTAILGYSELLASSPSLSKDQAAVAANISQQVRYARNLVSDLLSFARKPSGEKGPVDIASLLQRVVQMESGHPERPNVEIICKLSAAVPRVWGNTNALFQACLQLVGGIVSGLEAQGGGTLMVRTHSEKKHVNVEFSCLDPQGQPLASEKSPCLPAASKDSSLRFRAVQDVIEDHGGSAIAPDPTRLVLSFPETQHSAASAAAR